MMEDYPDMTEIQEDPAFTAIDADEETSSQVSEDMEECPSFDMSLLPEEILERIISFLSPYKDMDTVKLVSKQWNRVVKSVVKRLRRIFHQQLASCNVRWTQIIQDVAETDPPYTCIRSLRFSHSAAYVDGSIYVFGGCSSTSTTFNDLWRLDLSSRQWMRPVAMGSYPSPKACASMVVYKGKLILFGGWSHPIPYPLHQAAHYFSELHQYDPSSNRWSLLLTAGPEPDPVGGHSASVVGDTMVVFGGSSQTGRGSVMIWVYNFLKSSWHRPRILNGDQPEPRYGQFQCTLDDHHILIMGGCAGHTKVFNDFYILTIHPTDPWFWTKLSIIHNDLAAQQTWCHAACKVNNTVVVVAKSGKAREAKNEPARVMRVPVVRRMNNHNASTLARPFKVEPSPRRQQPRHHRQHKDTGPPACELSATDPSVPGSGGEDNPPLEADHKPQGEGEDNPDIDTASSSSSSNNRSLLALQQRLHRDCMNLSDRDNHHHNSQSSDDDDITDSHIERLQNRALNQAEGGGNPNHRNVNLQQQQQQPQQPQHPYHRHNPAPHQDAGPSQRVHVYRPNGTPYRQAIPMPSVRPNATSNRQRQLEALQRQEELLHSKSRELAAVRSRAKAPGVAPFGVSIDKQEEEEPAPPATILTKNCMDVHVVDISRALTDLAVEWQPQSELQPPGAPTETICSSLVEGRGELVLFGGVSREMNNPMMSSVAVNKLYFLHP